MLVDASGQAIIPGTAKRSVRVTDARIARICANMEDVFRSLHLTVICLHCGETPHMGNSYTDVQWKMECSCTKRVLVNPDVQRLS